MLLRAQRATPTEQAEPERRDDDEKMCVWSHVTTSRLPTESQTETIQ